MIASAGALCAAVNGLHNNLRAGSLLVDPYWVSFYVTNYKDGFRRRALIGSLCRAIAPHGISVIAINLLALLVACCLAAILVRSFTKLSAASSYVTRLFTFGFFVSVFAATFFDTLGDTLQLTFALFLAAHLGAHRAKSGPTVRLLLGLVLVVVGFFIHEGSLFFLVPSLPFLIRRGPRLADFIVPTLLLVALMGLSMHWSSLQPHLTYGAVLFPHAASFGSVDATPDFKSLLQAEASFDFGSFHNMLRFASKCLRLAVLLFAGVVAVSKCFPGKLFDRFLLLLACILFFNVPLWFIAHDWGRFLCYAFFFAIAGTSFWPPDERAADKSEPRLIAAFSRGIRHAGTNELISLAALGSGR